MLASDSSKHKSNDEVPCKIPLDPSISLRRAGPENGSFLNNCDASSNNCDAVSTLNKDDGISCFKMSSSELLMVSLPTFTRFVTATETAWTGRLRSGMAFPSSASSCKITKRDTYELNKIICKSSSSYALGV